VRPPLVPPALAPVLPPVCGTDPPEPTLAPPLLVSLFAPLEPAFAVPPLAGVPPVE
jgi:hypothetical protein